MIRRITQKLLITILMALAINGLGISTTYAQSDEERVIAMQIAETKTGGKALRAKYVKRRDGFRVRLIKTTKLGKERVIHLFISGEEIR